MIEFLVAIFVAWLLYRTADRKGWKFTIHIKNPETQNEREQARANEEFWKWKVGPFHWPD